MPKIFEHERKVIVLQEMMFHSAIELSDVRGPNDREEDDY